MVGTETWVSTEGLRVVAADAAGGIVDAETLELPRRIVGLLIVGAGGGAGWGTPASCVSEFTDKKAEPKALNSRPARKSHARAWVAGLLGSCLKEKKRVVSNHEYQS